MTALSASDDDNDRHAAAQEGPGEPAAVQSLRRAVHAAPTDLPLRLLLAEQLLLLGRRDAAVREAAQALALDPSSAQALELMNRAARGDREPPAPRDEDDSTSAGSSEIIDARSETPDRASQGTDRRSGSFDWDQAEADLGEVVPPMFVDDAEASDEPVFDVERSTITFADVGGMEHVKERLEVALLTPLRNPALRAMYAKSLRGGLLLYGPPGCGKTYIARAVAGEMGAGFISVSITDVLDMWIGSSERNLHGIFELARRSAPCVVFLDELDALGHKRSNLTSSGIRSTVNQLLQELDGIGSDNEGVFLLAASNQPWDIDPALRRPGRLDRMVLVLPPDEKARAAILRTHLAHRPVAGIDVHRLARETEGFSGADLAHLCESAAELALIASVRSGVPRMIEMADFVTARREIAPSTGPWFDSARTIATFANTDGAYDGILDHLKKRRR